MFKDAVEAAAFDFGPRAFQVDASSGRIPSQWAHWQILGRLAQDRDNGVLAHVNTPNVARDMLSIAQAHGRDKVQYWGISFVISLSTSRMHLKDKLIPGMALSLAQLLPLFFL